MLDNLLEADFKVTNDGKFYNINSTNSRNFVPSFVKRMNSELPLGHLLEN